MLSLVDVYVLVLSGAAAEKGDFERARWSGQVSLGLNIAGVALTVCLIIALAAVRSSNDGAFG